MDFALSDEQLMIQESAAGFLAAASDSAAVRAAMASPQGFDGELWRQIAEELCLSVKTISTYRRHILEKMQFTTNAEITMYAIQNKLLG